MGIRVTSATGSFIQLAEVVVADSEAIDVAAAANGGVAYALNALGSSGAANAIDGRTGGNAASGIYQSVGTAGDYLDIYFGRRIILSSIVLFGRTDADTAGNTFVVTVFDNFGRSLFTKMVDASAGPATIWFDVNGTAVVPGQQVIEGRGTSGTVPEPASWALLIAGFGLIGTALRRRRTGHAAA
ncbi:PEPxxWA-CTERM sorting domain-containing protein [Polymorphobacter megasporae]|nr:PEPxxWA-CTERM sorting domain-containing protein [Polymorphobacter sp. PAMC 29334]UAJ11962.1 PEPxxWA-CTERM sorting domain-containing protein [Polymorphobacter megasporae]